MSRRLYDISADLAAIESLLLDSDGELPEGEIGEAFERYFDDLTTERDAKLRDCCAFMRNNEIQAADCDAEIKRLQERKAAYENAAERVKKRVMEFMQRHDIKKLSLGAFSPRIQANGGPMPLSYPKEWEKEPATAPEKYHLPKVFLDKEAMRKSAELAYERISALDDALAKGLIDEAGYQDSINGLAIDYPVRLAARGVHLRF